MDYFISSLELWIERAISYTSDNMISILIAVGLFIFIILFLVAYWQKWKDKRMDKFRRKIVAGKLKTNFYLSGRTRVIKNDTFMITINNSNDIQRAVEELLNRQKKLPGKIIFTFKSDIYVLLSAFIAQLKKTGLKDLIDKNDVTVDFKISKNKRPAGVNELIKSLESPKKAKQIAIKNTG